MKKIYIYISVTTSIYFFSGYSTSNHSSPSTILVGISYNYCSSNDMFLLNSWEVHSGNPSDKNPFHLLLDYYRANEMKFSQVCFQGPTFSVLIPLVQKLRIPLVKVSDILAPSRSHEIQVSSQNPAKFTKTCKIPQNSQEILSNTCWYNIFETYLDYLGCLNAISYYKIIM